MAHVGILAVLCVWEARHEGHQPVLRPDVQVVVHLPVGLTHLARRVEQALRTRRGGGGGRIRAVWPFAKNNQGYGYRYQLYHQSIP